jgi:hypothetical protein
MLLQLPTCLKSFFYTWILALFCAAISGIASASAQTPPLKYTQVPFSDQPLARLPDSLKAYPAVYEFAHIYLENLPTNPLKVMVITDHNRIRINTEAGLNQYKTIEFGESSMPGKAVQIKIFSPSGLSRLLELKNMRKEENNGRKVVKVPLDGLEIGGAFEIILTDLSSDVDDRNVTLQSGTPIFTNRVTLRCPSTLEYKLKVYNGTANIAKEELKDSNLIIHTATTGLIMPLKEENFANKEALSTRLAITLHAVPGSSYTQSWNRISNSLIGALLPADAPDRKAILKLLKKIGAADKPPLVRVAMLEAYLKKNLNFLSGFYTTPFTQSVEKDKAAYGFGMVKYLVNLLDYHNIPFRFGGTVDRAEHSFDPDFVTYDNLTSLFIYLPDTRQYIFPTARHFMLGNTPDAAIGQKCLMIKPLNVNGAIGVKATIDSIPLPDSVLNTSHISARLKINPEDNSVAATVSNSHRGNTGNIIRNAFQGLSPKEMADLVKEQLFIKGAEGEISNVTLEGATYDGSVLNLPFVQKYSAVQKNTVEALGDELLVNVGWVIGHQVSLPKTAPRRYPVDVGEPKRYTREVILEIPEGYKAINIAGMEKKIIHQKGNCLFDLKVVQEGNTLKITNTEFYYMYVLPPASYADYEEVMNAAAFFNNLKVVLKKG